MSYARPSPRPGELYNRYAPPRPPPMENVYYAYSRSEAGGTRPGRPPPRYPMAEPYYRGASTRPAQRPSGYANSSYHAPGSPPPSTRRYNNEPSQGGYWGLEPDYHHHPPFSSSRPSAMSSTNRNPGFRQAPSSASRRPDVRDRPQQFYSSFSPNNKPTRRGNRPTTPDDYYGDDADEAGHSQPRAATQEADGSWSWNTIKKTVWGNHDASQSSQRIPPPPDNDQSAPGDQNPENQNTIWAKLANVGASFQKKLTQDEGYASDASDYEGESHLTRIMKKYYVEKAESAHDLPPWLFTPSERQEAESQMTRPQHSTHHGGREPGRRSEPGRSTEPRRGALDDIYAEVDERRKGHGRQDSKYSQDSGYGSSSSPARPRRGRYEDEPEYAPAAPSRRDQMPGRRPPPSQHAINPSSSRQYQQQHPRRPLRPAAPPTTVDYFPPSGQNDRYPSPAARSHAPTPGRRYDR